MGVVYIPGAVIICRIHVQIKTDLYNLYDGFYFDNNITSLWM